MSRQKKKKNSRFVMMPWEIVDSYAWEQLTNASRVAYLHLRQQIVSSDQEEIILTYRKMEPIMDRHTYANSISQLLDMGFITMQQRGGLHRKKNIYRLSNEWRLYSRPPSSVDFRTVTSVDSHIVEGQGET